MHSNYAQAAAAYRQAAAAVHPTVTVVKLYDAVLLAILQAMRAKGAGQHEEAFIKVMRAATILRGLDHALDFDKGAPVADRLHRVYKSYILALHMSFGKKDVIDRYRKLYVSLAELRNSWASIAGMDDEATEPALQAPAILGENAAFDEPSARPRDARFDASLFFGLTANEPASPRPAAARPRPARPARPRPAR